MEIIAVEYGNHMTKDKSAASDTQTVQASTSSISNGKMKTAEGNKKNMTFG